MSGKDASGLLQGRLRPTHYQGQREHGPWEQLDRDLEYDEMCFLASVILGKSVYEGKKQGLSKDVATEDKAARYLIQSQQIDLGGFVQNRWMRC